jgi:hypothetical protein
MQNIIKLRGLGIEKYVACRCSRLDPEGFGGIPAHQQQREIQSGIQAAYRGALLQAASCRPRDSVPGSWLLDYLNERGLIRRPKNQRSKSKK